MSRENTTIRMNPDLKTRSKSLAALKKRSLSDLIEEALLTTYPQLAATHPPEQAAA